MTIPSWADEATIHAMIGHRFAGTVGRSLGRRQSQALGERFGRQAHGIWTYRAVGPGERIMLAGGAELDVDAIFAGLFEIAGD